jgi:hypothetical protein
MNSCVLSIGFIPELVDLSPFPGLTPEKVRAGLASEEASLKALGYDVHVLLLDLGETAEAVLTESSPSVSTR